MSDHDLSYLILVVDDDPDHSALIKAVFSHRDRRANVHLTQCAEEAIAYLAGPWPDADYGRSERPDIIVLDVQMPGIGGIGFLEWFGEQDAIGDIPIVVFTSTDDPDVARQCVMLGAREFMVKPTDFNELVDVVQRVLDRWKRPVAVPAWGAATRPARVFERRAI